MSLQRALGVLILAATAACAGAPVPGEGRPDLSAVVWPAPPGEPEVRLRSIVPDERAERAATPWWRKMVGWLTGSDPRVEPPLALVRPFAVALGAEGSVFVADPDGGRVVRFTPSGERTEIRCDAPWGAPMALALAQDGSLYVADASAALVVRWRAGACDRLGAGSLERPTGLALAPDRIWVADPAGHRVVALSLQGEPIARIGTLGEGEGHFHFPTSIARARSGELLVVDSLNFRIVRLGADGAWLGAFGAPGEVDGGLARPKAVAAGEDATVFVSDAQRDEVLVFTPGGEFLYALGATGAAPGRFAHPAGLDVRSARLAVADSQNRRIQLFEILKERR